MAIANGAQHSLFYVAESTYGTTPSNPTYTPIPHTATTIGMTKDGIESEKLRGDRQVEDFRHGNKTIGGDISSELEYGAFDELIQAVMCGSFSTNVLISGNTRRSFTLERRFLDLATPEYHRFTGVEFNTLTLSVAPNAMVSMTLGIVGQNMTLNTSTIAGASDNADVGKTPFDSFTGTITEGGGSIATVTEIELTIENGLEPLFSVGSQLTNQPSIGKSRVTGTLGLYFDSKTVLEKFVNETESAIVLTLTDVLGNDYLFNLPRIKYNAGQPDVSGEGAITLSMPFVALFSDATNQQLKITRQPA